MTDTPPPTLTERIADALRTVAYSCDGTDCRATDQECEAAHPVRRPEPWRYVVRIEGSPEGLAAAVLAVVQPELDRIPLLEERVSRLTAALESANDVPARVAWQAFAEEDRLRAELDTLTAVARTNAAAHRVAVEECERLQAAIGAVRQLHQVRDHGGWQICTECSRIGHITRPWPCDTATALDTARTTTN
ncbi:hypothetical protein [Kitasatospora sp. NPDC087314]|uniref:hypothetical protein n=1 Tax=Kitasatospora sp. NPDC087314 TaxID=3364068 RepID=UPI00380C95E3